MVKLGYVLSLTTDSGQVPRLLGGESGRKFGSLIGHRFGQGVGHCLFPSPHASTLSVVPEGRTESRNGPNTNQKGLLASDNRPFFCKENAKFTE